MTGSAPHEALLAINRLKGPVGSSYSEASLSRSAIDG
jgi:hypothetical protein